MYSLSNNHHQRYLGYINHITMEAQMVENLHTIQDLQNLIAPHIPCDQSRILAVNYSRLRYIDQYGSTLLKLTIELINTSTGEDWTLSALAKTLPKFSIAHDIGHVRAIFKNEVAIYTVARRAIDRFLKFKGLAHGEDFFVNTFGGRINLNGTKDVDHNAALIIRDFKALGYKTVHRRTGFDLDSTKAILATLARFHGSTLGFKLTKYWDFKDKVSPYLGKCFRRVNFAQRARTQMTEVLKSEGFSTRALERAVATFDRGHCGDIREPWATFTHTNAWMKNILVKYDKNKQPLDVKLKGFQESEYNSPLRDLLFFLFSSVQLVVLKQCLDDLIDFYYFNLINVLRTLDVDVKAFSPALFKQELKATACSGEFYKTVCMLYPILGTNNNPDIEDIVDKYPPCNLKDPLHVNRLCYIVKEFDRRDWLCL